MISQDLLKRLVYAKYIFWQGCEILDKKIPIADGMAVLSFQDAVELMLRTVTEHSHAHIKDNTPFNQIIDEIEKATKKSVPYKSSLLQLNKARVNFKHYGLSPVSEDVQKFRRDLDLFLPESTRLFFNLDYYQVSLADVILKHRVRNYLKKAEKELEVENYKESIQATAIALQLIFLKAIEYDHPTRGLNLRASSHRDRNFDEIVSVLEDHENQLNMLTYGINLAEYHRFKGYVPHVNISDTGRIMEVVYEYSVDDSFDVALFCLRFVIETALLVQQNRIPDRSEDYYKEKFLRYRVMQKTPIFITPNSVNPEFVREAEAGEILIGYFDSHNIKGHLAILHDDEIAYIQEDAVEKMMRKEK